MIVLTMFKEKYTGALAGLVMLIHYLGEMYTDVDAARTFRSQHECFPNVSRDQIWRKTSGASAVIWDLTILAVPFQCLRKNILELAGLAMLFQCLRKTYTGIGRFGCAFSVFERNVYV